MGGSRSGTARVALMLQGILLTGLPSWRQPYGDLVMTHWTVLLGLAGQAVLAFGLTWSGRLSAGASSMILGSAFPLAVLLRVIAETLRDPTAHNLWPLELLAATSLSAAMIWPAALLGRWLHRRRQP